MTKPEFIITTSQTMLAAIAGNEVLRSGLQERGKLIGASLSEEAVLYAEFLWDELSTKGYVRDADSPGLPTPEPTRLDRTDVHK